jgi:hypothetical protein
MMFVATINVPGYLPMDDEPPMFETAAEAWQYLADERDYGEDQAEFTEADPTRVGDVAADLRKMDGTGTVYGFTPGYEGEHDLGLAYSVTAVECECAYEPGDSGHEFHCPIRGAL